MYTARKFELDRVWYDPVSGRIAKEVEGAFYWLSRFDMRHKTNQTQVMVIDKLRPGAQPFTSEVGPKWEHYKELVIVGQGEEAVNLVKSKFSVACKVCHERKPLLRFGLREPKGGKPCNQPRCGPCRSKKHVP